MHRKILIPALCLLVLASAAACSRKQTKEQYLESGNQYAAKQQFKEAIIEYRNALGLDSLYGDARYRLAYAYEKTGDLVNSSREYVRSAELLPNNTDAQLKAGQILLLSRHFDEAKVRAERVLSLDAKNVDAQILKGNATAGLKDLDGAIAEIDEAIKLSPTEGRAFAALATMKMMQGQQAEAEEAFKRAVELQPTSEFPLLSLANFYWSIGRAPETEAALKQAVDVQPKAVLARRALAAFYLSTNRLPEAEAPLKVLAAIVNDIPSRLALADYYARTNRRDDAAAALKAVAADKEGFAEATVRLADLSYRENRHAEAYRELDEVLAQKPKHAGALILKSRFLLAERKIDESIASAREAVAADPRSAAAQYQLGSALAKRADVDDAIKAFNEVLKLNPKATAAQLQLSQLSLYKGAVPESLQFAQQALKDTPNSGVARLLMARGMAASGDVAGAEKEMTQLLKTYPTEVAVHTQMGRLQLFKKNLPAARKEFERALELSPQSLEALSGIVAVDLGDKNAAHARTLVESRLKDSPDDVGVLLLAASVYGATGDAKQQEETLRHAIDIDATNMQAMGGLAGLLVRQRRLDEAKAEYEAITKRQPTSVSAPTMVGLLLEAQQKPAEALQVYEKLLATNPNAAVAANNLAWLYAERGGNLDMALQLAQTAKQNLPNVPQVNDTLGWVYYKKDLPALAIEPFRESIRADPKNAQYHYHLGLAYTKTGDTLRAVVALDEAVKLQPNYKEAADARKALASK